MIRGHSMVGGGLMAIFFVCTLVCWAIFTLVYSIFASHYFLTTLTDSSSGQDEVQFPRESIFDWWWKPLLCGWVLVIWTVGSMFVLSPLVLLSPEAFLVVWGLVVWFAYPLSLSCSLYSQNWLVFVHGGVLKRMIGHFAAFIYVNVITFVLFAGSLYVVMRTLTDNPLWGAAAIVLVPATLLLYARHWGRFAWLSLNFLPGKGQTNRVKPVPGRMISDPWAYDDPPPTDDPVGKPDASTSPTGAAAKQPAPVGEVDDWTDTSPYTIVNDPSLPSMDETPSSSVPAVPLPTSAAAPVEEEDEWATEKKPYNLSGADQTFAYPAPAPSAAQETTADADMPVTATQYHEDRHKREKKAARRAEKAKRTMPAQSKKTPTFNAALFVGVWRFMFYPSTLIIWALMAALTVVELLLLYMLGMSVPRG